MMNTNATTTTRTHHNGQLAAVRRAVLRSGNSNKRWIPAFAGMTSYNHDANGSGRVATQQRGTHRRTPCGCNTISQSDSANAANTRNYVYDTNDRLVEVRDGNNTLIAVYSYDPFGRRLSKDTGTKKIYYLYNEEGLIAEADASGQLTKSYGYAPQSSFTTNPLWMKSGNGSTGSAQAYYTYQNDHLGTPQKLLTQSGQTVWSATYDSYGNATIDPAYTIVNNLRYPGQYYDAETGLHNNWMRYYDPRTVGGGRYITSDPIGLRGGVNFYTYVGGNPIGWVDPLGLYTEIIVWQPVTWTDSSFGHISSNVNGKNYSWGPKGWDTNSSASSYAENQSKFRSGVGTILNLTPAQEKKLAECYAKNRKNYGKFNNNCGDPHKDCLKEATGVSFSDSFFPVNIGNDSLNSPFYGGSKFYSGPSRGFGADAPWAR